MKKKWRWIACIIILLFFLLDYFHYIPHKKYKNEDFHIETLTSDHDKDQDGVDDQSDILSSTFKYLEKRPKYKSNYYTTGYPNDGYGVCTDVVAYGLFGAGYDLQELVNQDILKNPDDYQIDVIDKNIDFRRVRNLDIYFKHTAISLTTDLNKIEEWQGGDIVVFHEHIGIISNHRNSKGIPFLLHHAHPCQLFYEEDVLSKYEILGHYRIRD